MEELDPQCQVLSVTSRGYGKRTPVEKYPRQGRGGLGVINLKVTDKTGEVVGVKSVTPTEGLMLITQEGMIIRLNVSGVREVAGRKTEGVRLMNLDPEDRIVAVAKLAEKDEETEIELAKDDGGPMPAELELEAAEDDGESEILEDTDEEDGGPDETVH